MAKTAVKEKATLPKELRDVGVTSVSEKVLTKIMREAIVSKKEASAAEKLYKQHQAAIKTLLKQLKLKEYSCGVTDAATAAPIRAYYKDIVNMVVDVRALAKLLKDKKDKFFSIIKATQTDVKAELGESVLNTLLIEETNDKGQTLIKQQFALELE